MSWRAALIDAPTQAGKTWKCLDVLKGKLKAKSLVIFITQANCTASVLQLGGRLEDGMFDKVLRAKDLECFNSSGFSGRAAIIDFWNTRNTRLILEFVAERAWEHVIVVIDECEQGGLKGVKSRLHFIRQLEMSLISGQLHLVLITATVANLSKSIYEIAASDSDGFWGDGDSIVRDIIMKKCVEHHFAVPPESYISPSWFHNSSGVWRKLEMPKGDEVSEDEYDMCVLRALKALPEEKKELCLIVTSTRKEDHRKLVVDLLDMTGFNVVVELNADNCKSYRVSYMVMGEEGIKVFNLDYKKFTGTYGLSYILKAGLFHDGCEIIRRLRCKVRRPLDYPVVPRVAIVAGHIAGRGVTIQNPFIGFTCTSFCFLDTKDLGQRGAMNAQRFGRACGMLREAFEKKPPVLIATEAIIRDAVANEKALWGSVDGCNIGDMVSLKDLITKEDWDRVVASVASKEKLMKIKASKDASDGVCYEALRKYWFSKNLLIGKMIRFIYEAGETGVTFIEFKAGIGYEKSDDQFMNNIKNGLCPSASYGWLWRGSGVRYVMNPNVRSWIVNKLNCTS